MVPKSQSYPFLRYGPRPVFLITLLAEFIKSDRKVVGRLIDTKIVRNLTLLGVAGRVCSQTQSLPYPRYGPYFRQEDLG